jgi:serine/threonine-protein kinase
LGRYELGEEIARGGMGAIFLARDPTLNRDLAVKVLKPELHDRPEMVRRFVEEAQITAQLPHPGIVPVHELGQDVNGLPFLAMKLVRGDTLAELLARRASPQEDLPRFVGIFEQVCQAVAFAHSRRVIHRDLKPANVMVGRFGEVQVMDWGVAKVLGTAPTEAEKAAGEAAASMIRTLRTEAAAGLVGPAAAGGATEAGTVLGTPAYMPPEQAAGQIHKFDERCDVFGLGAILCEVLTGKPPYCASETWRIVYLAALGELTEAFRALEGCGADAELVAVAKECLSPEMEKRPRDAGVVAERVAAYQRGVQERLRQAEQQRVVAEARAQEARATARAERRARRRTVALVSVLTVAVLTGGTAAAWYFQDQATRRARAVADTDAALQEARTWLDQQGDQEARDPERWAATVSLADAAVQRAEAAVASAAVGEDWLVRVQALRAEVGPRKRDSRLRIELDRIRLEQTAVKEGNFDLPAALTRYRTVLSAYGIDLTRPAAAGDVVRRNGLRSELLAALENWARLTTDAAERKQLRAVLEAAEPEQDGLRARWQRAARKRDGAALAELARQASHLSAADLVTLSHDLRRLREVEAAERLLRQAQQRYPDDFWVNHDLGMVLREQQPPQLAEAARYLTAAAALRSHSPGALVNLGAVLDEQSKHVEAEVVYRRALTFDPEYAQGYVNLGNALDMQGKHGEAVAEYRKAIALQPNIPLAHYNLGLALDADGKWEEAEAADRRAIELDPGFPYAHNNLGMTLFRQGKKEEAIAAFRKAVDLAPKYAQARRNLALAHQQVGASLEALGKGEEAVAEYRKAIELEPTNATRRKELGLTLLEHGKVLEADAELRKAIDLDPKLAHAHILLGVALKEQGKYVEASAELRKAIDLDPKEATAHANLGNVLMAQGKHEEGIAELRKAIALAPKDAECHINLGAALFQVKKFEEAAAEGRKAIDLDPNSAMAHNNLAGALHAQGKNEAAVVEFHKAIELGPRLPQVYLGLGSTLRHLGQLAEARTAVLRCLELLPSQHPWRGPASDLLQECEAALNEKLSAIIRGAAHPANTAEMVAFAQLCRKSNRMSAAAKFYSDAFAADPKLTGDLSQQHRYSAACSAAMAAAGQDKDADKLDAKQRQRLRHQALEWLHADLDALRDLLTKTRPPQKERVRKALQHWQEDTNLATIRDNKELTALPTEERDACKKLWADVAALLDKARAPR